MRRSNELFDYQWRALAFTLAAIFSGLLIYTAFQLISPIRGAWRGTIEADRICITFDRAGWLNDEPSARACFDWHEFSVLPIRHRGTFELYRPQGTIRLSGAFADKTGRGSFEFIPAEAPTRQCADRYSDEDRFRQFLRTAGQHHTGQQACSRHCRQRRTTAIF